MPAKPTLAPRAPGRPKARNDYSLMESQSRPTHPEAHDCAFCGKTAYAHRATRLRARLFCDNACRAAYKLLHLWPRRQVLIQRPLPRKRVRTDNPALRELLASSATWVPRRHR